jgi:hypothetical protein
MKNSSLLLIECRQVYESIEHQIEKGALELADERKWIERAFGLAMKTWLDIEEMANNYQFLNRKEEVYFYKTLKPGFTGLIEYFTLLYKSIVFQPDDLIERDVYWIHEWKNCKESISLYMSGCLYYEQQQSNTDMHFLQQSNQQPLLFGLNISRLNFTATSYSHLLGGLIAMKRYEKYIQFKLNGNTEPLKNQSYFERHSVAN